MLNTSCASAYGFYLDCLGFWPSCYAHGSFVCFMSCLYIYIYSVSIQVVPFVRSLIGTRFFYRPLFIAGLKQRIPVVLEKGRRGFRCHRNK